MQHSITVHADNFPLIRDVGFGMTDQWFCHPDRLAEFNGFLYIASGQFQVIEDYTEYILGAHEVLFLKKDVHHWGELKTSPGTSFYWVSFYDKSFNGNENYEREMLLVPKGHYFAEENYRFELRLPKTLKLPNGFDFEEKMKVLLDTFQSSHHLRMVRVSMQAMELFLQLYDLASEQNRTARSELITLKIIEYLRTHANSELDSQDLANTLQLNYNYLSTLFKKSTGKTIISYHTWLRMNKAIQLLKNTSLNISEISELLGYKNPHYFSRVFKKTLGYPPSEYLNKFY